MQKKILIIDNSVAFTGAFKCAFNEAALLSATHKVSFVVPENSKLVETLNKAGIPVHTMNMLELGKSVKKLVFYLPYLIRNGFALRRIVKKEGIDIVQVNDFYNLLGVFLKMTGVKVRLITNVRFLPSALPGPLRKLWTTLAQKYADTVICVSDAVLKQLPPNVNTIRIYDPVSFPEQLPVVQERAENKWIQLLYIGNYIQGKGQDFAIEAFEKAYRQNNALRLQFAGGDMGLEKNRQFKQSLQDRVKAEGLEEVVTFLPFVTNVEEVIKNADIILNFSESESFSMTCLEASFYGRPVIATKCGGPEEIIDHEKTGLLVGNRDIVSMAEGILKLAAQSPARRYQMGAAGRDYVKEKFSTERFLAAFNSII